MFCSGDNKTEKAARSAQVALVDNGSMTDTLGFVEGRHEMFHFLFLMVDVCLDIFADKENLEESSSLSRIIQWMNPKLINKKGKDSYYQYRDLLIDIYTG